MKHAAQSIVALVVIGSCATLRVVADEECASSSWLDKLKGDSQCRHESRDEWAAGTSLQNFLNEYVFDQGDRGGNSWSDPFSSLLSSQHKDRKRSSQNKESAWSDFFGFLTKKLKNGETDGTSTDAFSEMQFVSFSGEDAATDMSMRDMYGLFSDAWTQVQEQMNASMAQLLDTDVMDRVNVMQLYYFMQHEEQTKNAVWKRRQHRFAPALELDAAEQLGDALYMSHLAYVRDCQTVHESLQTFRQHAWMLRNCTTTSRPHQPAHYLAVQRVSDSVNDQSMWRWIYPRQTSYLEVALVIRGTQSLADVLSDALHRAVEYQDGKVHDGTLQATRWLVDLYRQDLLALLESSRRDKLKLWLFGHSLGAGVAALSAIELNNDELIEARAVGFGTPSVVSPALGDRYQNVITSVIHDADMVPRLSVPSVVDALRRMVQHNFSAECLADYDQLISHLAQQGSALFGSATWMDGMSDNLRQWLELRFSDREMDISEASSSSSAKHTAPHDIELIPPGECVHLYRDGRSYHATITNCTLFSEIEVVQHMVYDHLVPVGYYPALTSYVRTQKGNITWNFDFDLLSVPTP